MHHLHGIIGYGEVTSAGNFTQFHQFTSLDDRTVFGCKTDIVLIAAHMMNGNLGGDETFSQVSLLVDVIEETNKNLTAD